MEPKKELTIPADAEKRLAGKAGAEFAATLREIASEIPGIKVVEQAKEPIIQLTDAQAEKAFSGILSETKKVVEEATTKLEKKYDLTHGEAAARANEFVSDEIKKSNLKREEDKIIGARFASVMKAQLGLLRNAGEFDKALDDERKFLAKHYGREVADSSLGTDSTGGFLSPELWVQRLYQNLAKTSLARRYSTLIDMGTKELLRMPKMTGGVTAYVVNEGVAGTTSQPTFSQFTLQPRKIGVISNPISIELIQSGDPSIIDLITADAMRAFGRKEDEAVFVGSDSVFTGLLESSTNVVYLGGSSTSGKTSYAQITFDDLFRLQNELDEQYTPDGDTEGSGGIAGEAFYWLNKSVLTQLQMLKGDDQYYMPITGMMRDNKILGYGFKRVLDLTAPTTASQKFGVFGNLKNVYFGYRPGITMDTLKEGTVNGVNLGMTGQYAMRFFEFFDQALIDSEGLSILSTSDS